MDHHYREQAPVSEAAWAQIESEATRRLGTQLAARKLVDFHGPHGWAHSATDLGRTDEAEGPVSGVTAARRRVLPLVELRAPFDVSRRELDDADRGAEDLEFGELEEAVRRIALAENGTVFHGYAAAGMDGIVPASAHEPITVEDDMEQYPRVVARAVDRLRRSGVGGPYGLAIDPEPYTSIVETAEHGGHLLLDHLRQILGGPVVWAPGVEDGVVLSLRGGDFVLDCGEDLSIGYRDHDAQTVSLYVEESISFRVLEPAAAVALRRHAA
jgi:uncharacterized linocin/CFP29 family protein